MTEEGIIRPESTASTTQERINTFLSGLGASTSPFLDLKSSITFNTSREMPKVQMAKAIFSTFLGFFSL